MEASPLATISVVVPAYDAGATLRQCLEPLLRLRRAGEVDEVIVVDDASTDETRAIAQAMGAVVVQSAVRLGPAAARNAGAKAARNELLWFVDADVVVHEDAPRLLRETFHRTGAAAVFGAYDDCPMAPGFLSQYKNLVHHHYHRRHEGEAETFWAGCGAVRKPVFMAAGGFDAVRYPRPAIEDIELGARLRRGGALIWLAPAVQGKHLKAWSLASLLHADIFCRALPWARLVHAGEATAHSLNLAPGERLRALLALALATSIAPALARALPPLVPFGLFALACIANLQLLALFNRRKGAWFAGRALLFHQLYYLYAMAAFAWAWVETRAVRRPAVTA